MTRPRHAGPLELNGCDRRGNSTETAAALVRAARPTSLWQWTRAARDTVPARHRYTRDNASIGVNGVVFDNVNAGVARIGQTFSNDAPWSARSLR